MTDLLIHRDATFANAGKLRLTLTRSWDDTLPTVCLIGHNPSDADRSKEDPTTHRVNHFVRAWGYGGWTLVNMYPLVSADPQDARDWAKRGLDGQDWGVRDDLFHNRLIVAKEAKKAALVVACWGAIMRDYMWADSVLEEIMQGEEPWPSIHVFGLTNSGAPKHPLARGKHRVPNDARPILWQEGIA